MLVEAAGEPASASAGALAAVAPVGSDVDADSALEGADLVVGTAKRDSGPEGNVSVGTPRSTAVTSPPRRRHRFALAVVLAGVFGLGVAIAHARSTGTSAAPAVTSALPGPGSPGSPESAVVAPAEDPSTAGTLTDAEAAPGADSGNAATSEATVVIDPASDSGSDPAVTTPTDQATIPAAAPPTTRPPGAPWTLTLTGQMVFPYLGAFIKEPSHIVDTVTLTGACDGRGPCSLTSLFPGTPYEGQPATFALTPAADGFTLSVRFDHVEPGAQCAPISIRLELSVLVVGGPDGPGLIGSGQYVPDRRSTALPDGSLGCTTDVGVFSFASKGLVPPPRPTPAPPPPLV